MFKMIEIIERKKEYTLALYTLSYLSPHGLLDKFHILERCFRINKR